MFQASPLHKKMRFTFSPSFNNNQPVVEDGCQDTAEQQPSAMDLCYCANEMHTDVVMYQHIDPLALNPHIMSCQHPNLQVESGQQLQMQYQQQLQQYSPDY